VSEFVVRNRSSQLPESIPGQVQGSADRLGKSGLRRREPFEADCEVGKVGLVDKMKTQAAVLAEKAQEGAKLGQEKVSQLQAKRQSDALLAELGRLVYLERVGRPSHDSEARQAELVKQLQTFESTNGPIQPASSGFSEPKPEEPPA
jgi:hypothetical protein